MVVPIIRRMQQIEVDQEVIDHIMRQKQDFRVSTSCNGPVVVPISIKSPKETDIIIKLGEYKL